LAEAIKKICFVIPRAYYLFNPDISGVDDKIGGAQKQAFLFSTELAKNKTFDIHFCVADFGQKRVEKHHNITVWKSFNFDSFIIKKTIVLFKILKKINADIYVFRAADSGVALGTLFIKLFLKKKVFYMLASNIESSFSGLRKVLGLYTAFTMPLTYKYADKISVQSQEQYNLFIDGRKRKPNAIIRNIIPINNQTKKTDNFILWVGRLDKIKSPELFLTLAKKFPYEKFVMIAPVVRDSIEYGNKIKAQTLKIKNLKYIDFVKPKEMEKYYQQTKIYVITSESEGFSNTMAEAMAAKCPVLSYTVNPDNILEGAGFCAARNTENFHSSFEKLLKSSKLRITLGTNGYNYIRKEHRKDIIIEKLTKILSN